MDKQAKKCCRLLIQQMAIAEEVTKDLKRRSQWGWIRAMNSIVNRAEEIVQYEVFGVQ